MLILNDEQKVVLSVAPKTAAGNPAKIDGKPVWSVSDDTVITLVVSDDGLSTEAITTGTLGVSQVSVSVDADLGEGVRTLSGTLDITVNAAEATTVGISAGVPVLK